MYHVSDIKFDKQQTLGLMKFHQMSLPISFFNFSQGHIFPRVVSKDKVCNLKPKTAAELQNQFQIKSMKLQFKYVEKFV